MKTAGLPMGALAAALLAASPGPASSDDLAQPSRLSPYLARKAEALFRTQLPCLGCHALGGRGGRIGPALDDVGARRSLAYLEAVLDDPQRVVPGTPMPRTPMSPRLRDLLARWLSTKGRPTEQAAPTEKPTLHPAPAPSTSPPNGAALYGRWCASCHGAEGTADGPNARHLGKRPAIHADPRAMAIRPDAALYDVISAGGAILDSASPMPAFGATLTRAEIDALVAHIRKLCACAEPAWVRDNGARR